MTWVASAGYLPVALLPLQPSQPLLRIVKLGEAGISAFQEGEGNSQYIGRQIKTLPILHERGMPQYSCEQGDEMKEFLKAIQIIPPMKTVQSPVDREAGFGQLRRKSV